ncbi:MAG: HK97-gp10 family putative phage morphogenesis protein [Candidatus Binatia bacterium]|nr:HK97-gp10 family putative phage morphogenesis protein [Candidatus Binatia bacterium]
MSYITEWHDKELIAKVSGKVINGMDDACRFAVAQAKANAPRRGGTLQGEITYEVKASKNEIVGYVGLPKKGKAFYGRFFEFGTRKMAARPFLRPAVFGNMAEIMRRIAGK